jgi:tetratricopeptide (TPR) repeat protein
MSTPSADTDRNLLFGVLALQADLLDASRFAEACSAWAARKDRSLADLVVERGWLTPADRADVDKLLDRKLKKHDGDARAGLAEATTSEVMLRSLASLADPDVRRSLAGTPLVPGPVQFPTTAHVPEVRDRYTLIRLHATGGIGRVWLAHDDSLGRDVALKDLRPDRGAQPAVAARFLKEARITGQLEHPGIVPIYEVGRRSDDEPPFYTMRFVRGHTLSEAVAGYHRRRSEGVAGPLELRGLLGAFVAVCNAVAYAHSRGVLHRDLKPSNVVLGDFGEVVVLDWGLARLLGQADGDLGGPVVEADSGASETVQGQVLGTPAYMAPEQAEGRLDLLSQTTDVYGLGAMLYAILTGRPPFAGGETATLLRQVIHDEPARPRSVQADVPAALEAVCLKALARQPQDRYASAKDLAAEVQRWLADEPVQAWREPWTARAARWARQRRPLVVGTVVFLLCAVVALSASAVLIFQEQQRTAQQKHEAEQERDRARKHFDAARQLSLRLIDISEKQVPKVPQAEPARRALLDAALETFQPIQAQRPDDPELQEHVAFLHRFSANFHRLLGATEAAERSYHLAIQLWEKRAASEPAAPLHRIHLAETLRDYSAVQKRQGRLRDATDSLRRSVQIAEELPASGRGQPDHRRVLATALLDLSDVEQTRGLFREAEQSSRRVAAVYRALLAVPGEQQGAFDQLFLAAALSRQGVCQRELGQPDEALRCHARAVRQLRALLAHKEDVNGMHFLARALVEQARTLARFPQRGAEAERDLDEALGTWRDLGGRFPQTPLYREWQAVALQARGELRTALKRPTPAAEDLDGSRSLLEGLVKQYPAVPGYHGHLGRTCGALGRLALACGNPREATAWFARAVKSLRVAVDKDSENALHRAALEGLESEARRLGR